MTMHSSSPLWKAGRRAGDRTARRMIAAGTAIVAIGLAVACGPAAPRPTRRPSTAPRDEDPVWHYEGAEGPEHWGALSPAFATCRSGRNQSPVDLVPAASAVPPRIVTFQFPPASLRIAHHEHVADGINNGHTIQINYDDGDTLTLGDTPYALVQYHFHDPSEHTVAGRRFPMEMHMVHRSATGELAVVGVLIERGRHNAAFDPVWTNLPTKKGVETHYEHVMVDVDALLPASRTSYRYHGSLTTPPCTEGVEWIVLATPIALDTPQLDAFSHLIHANARPVQPLHGRTILTDTVH